MSIVGHLSGKVYPDRSFSIGIVPRPKKARDERDYDRQYSEQFDSYSIAEYNYLGYEVKTESWLDGRVKLNRFIKCPELSRPTKRYGQKGISANGKRTVKNCAVIMEKEYGIRRLGFVTATLPNLSKEQMYCVTSNWRELVRLFFQRVRRRLLKLGLPDDIIAVTEIQEKRYRKYRQVAPHIHFLYVFKKRSHESGYAISANEFRLWWCEAINNVLRANKLPLVLYEQCLASVDCQVVKKSASGYLAKYMSKGGEIVKDIVEEGRGDELPKQWWSSTKALKKRYKSAIITLDSAFCSFVFYNLGDCLADNWFSWVSYVDILIGEEYRTMGCMGTLTEECYKALSQ